MLNFHLSPKLKKNLLLKRVEKEGERKRERERERERERGRGNQYMKTQHEPKIFKCIQFDTKQRKGFRTTAQLARVKIKKFHHLGNQSVEKTFHSKTIIKNINVLSLQCTPQMKTATK